MATVTLHGNPFSTIGNLPAPGDKAPDFTLTGTDLAECARADFSGNTIVLNIFPSVDTPVCAASVRQFNAKASGLDKVAVLCVSMDLPFALARFCGAEGLDKVKALSAFRHTEFAAAYGIGVKDGPLAGLLARAVVIIDANNQVVYTELGPEIAQEPDYDAALKALA